MYTEKNSKLPAAANSIKLGASEMPPSPPVILVSAPLPVLLIACGALRLPPPPETSKPCQKTIHGVPSLNQH